MSVHKTEHTTIEKKAYSSLDDDWCHWGDSGGLSIAEGLLWLLLLLLLLLLLWLHEVTLELLLLWLLLLVHCNLLLLAKAKGLDTAEPSQKVNQETRLITSQ